jgi:hypothetical protein
VTGVLAGVLVVLSGAGAVLVTLPPDPSRPVLTAAWLAVAATVVAAASGWRLAGTLALTLTTGTVLLGGALDPSDLRPVQVVVATGLLLALVTALDQSEAAVGPPAVTVVRAPLARRLGLPALAVAAACLVAATAAQDVVPSVGTVLAGLAAVVAALVVATRAHRG